MEIWSYILGSFGLGALFSDIIRKTIDYKLQIRKFRFEKLYIERAKVIQGVYERMVTTQRAFLSLTAPLQFANEFLQKEARKKLTAETANNFVEYFDINRLYFDENLAQKLDTLNEKLKIIWNQFKCATEGEPGKIDVKEWSSARDKIIQEIPQLRKEIETQFRQIIGIEN